MTLNAEIIKQSNVIEQYEVELLSSILFQNVSIISIDNEQSIKYKIEILKSLKEYLIKNIEIENLTSENQQLDFINLLSKISEQIENFEIITGIKDIKSLKRAAKTFSKKTQFPLGFIE
jgi:hypothetical protein